MGRRVISPRCKVCQHSERQRIEYLAASGAPVKPLADKFGLTDDSLGRHMANHVSDDFKRAAKIGPFRSEEDLRRVCAEEGTSVVESLRGVYAGLAQLYLTCVESGAVQGATSVAGRMHENLRLRSQITGELMPAPSNVTVNNLFLSPEWLQDLSRDLMGLIRLHPEVKDDLVALLRRRLAPETPLLEATAEPARHVA